MDESIKIEMFGIGKLIDKSKSVDLFRRDLENTKWMSNNVKVKGERFLIQDSYCVKIY